VRLRPAMRQAVAAIGEALTAALGDTVFEET
jgi:hypothetical protein